MMSCYTHKMASISWPQTLWCHFTLSIYIAQVVQNITADKLAIRIPFYDHWRCPFHVWAQERCRISPPRFLAECWTGNWTRVVLFCCILGCLLFLICIEFVCLYFPLLSCLSVSVKWLAVKTASEMTYTVSSGALNSTPTNHPRAERLCNGAVYIRPSVCPDNK